MNPGLARLQAYPFERLRALLADARPAPLPPISLSIGEPRHAPPEFVLAALARNLAQLDSYPATRGLPTLRQAMADALDRRCLPGMGSQVDPERMVLPVNGTREALFALVQAVVDPTRAALAVMPNPGYQIYEGAALLAGAEPYYLNTTSANRYQPDLEAVPREVWQRCQLLFLCSPGNPTGTILPVGYLQKALRLAEQYDFIVAADECYADLYLDESEPSPSLLAAAKLAGNADFRRCVVFHSLSKRSSMPGLRSGLVAGDAALIEKFLLYRTYHGCAMPLPTQLASVVAWEDDAHVRINRALYRAKFDAVLPILDPVLPVERPDGAFYLWARVGGDDAAWARALYEHSNLIVLPGSFMARTAHGENPGAGRIRISLVPELSQCVEAAQRLRRFLTQRSALDTGAPAACVLPGA